MKKFNKIICCLIMPVLAIFGFAGCGHARSAEDIKNRYSEMKVAHPDMFKGYVAGDEENKADKLEDTIKVSYSGEMEKLSTLTFDDFTNDKNLFNRYWSLINLQEIILENVFVYYNEEKDAFFENLALVETEKKELKKLYNSIEDLQEDIEDFKVARDKIESTTNIMTFSGVVRADVTSYAYEYNMLIENCFEFVRYFKELNTKYYYSGEVTPENENAYVRHYLNEALFDLTEVMYYKFIKAANNVNECDLSNRVCHDESTPYAYEEGFFNIVVNGGKVGEIKDDKFVGYVSSEVTKSVYDCYSAYKKNLLSASYKDNLNKFLEVRTAFNQKLKVFKVVYENMDYYSYNERVLKALNEDNVYSSKPASATFYTAYFDEIHGEVTNIEIANIQLIESFYYTTIIDYVEAICSLIA